MKRSLVLGGGGVVGVAWLVGVLTGLAEAGIDLMGEQGPDEVIGTSAGSIVGALVAKKQPAARLQEMTLDDASTAVVEKAMPMVDFMAALQCFETWAALPDNSAASLAAVGALALRAPTISEDEWSHSTAQTVGTDWPSVAFGCTAVNAATGEFKVWTKDSGVALDLAVSSSCTVPAIFPPVTIGEDRFVDGGLRSGTSADLAKGAFVLVVAPIGSHTDPMDVGARRQLTAETVALQARGATVVELLPDLEANAATLSSPLGRMDAAMRVPAIEQGRRQGQALASQLTGW
jgi:NTE family protein